MKNHIITIDGPAGSGKSSIAREVAKRLGYTFLDTGALYRAAAIAIDESGCSISDENWCDGVISRSRIHLSSDRVFLNGRDITDEIRTPRISELASAVAVHPSVRAALLTIQRFLGEKGSLVAEGRDTGSVVFPDADVKIYLDASGEERARRRQRELAQKGSVLDTGEVMADMQRRDQRDRQRDHSPLVIPQHAHVVDTTHLTLDQVLDRVLSIIRENLTD